MTLYATGCIFEYDEAHPIGGAGFKEEDKPNFDGAWPSFHNTQSFYFYFKGPKGVGRLVNPIVGGSLLMIGVLVASREIFFLGIY